MKRIIKIFKNLKQSKLTFQAPFNHSSKNFWYITLLPTFDFVIDRQMVDIFTFDSKVSGGIIEYSLGFQWLIFSFYLSLEYNIK